MANDICGWRRVVAIVLRVLLGALFLFSGALKAVDPWGTAIKIGEYLSTYSIASDDCYNIIISIALCGAELLIGLCLVVGVLPRLFSGLAVLFLSLFTIQTLLGATILPIEDCGCFGEAVKLTPWQTVAKNLVALPVSVAAYLLYRSRKWFAVRYMYICAIAAVMAFGLPVWSYLHLPPVDFMPFKVGVNLREVVNPLSADKMRGATVKLVYKNRHTAEVRTFDVSDEEWQDESTWEWVETKIESPKGVENVGSMLDEFKISDSLGDATYRIVNESIVYMICVDDYASVSSECRRRIARLIRRADSRAEAVIALTPQMLNGVTYMDFGSGVGVRFYNMDASVLKSLLRAKVGVVVLRDGVIAQKMNCRDVE